MTKGHTGRLEAATGHLTPQHEWNVDMRIRRRKVYHKGIILSSSGCRMTDRQLLTQMNWQECDHSPPRASEKVLNAFLYQCNPSDFFATTRYRCVGDGTIGFVPEWEGRSEWTS